MRGRCVITGIVACLLLVEPCCNKQPAQDTGTKDKEQITKVEGLLPGKWTSEKENKLVTLDFAARMVKWASKMDGRDPSGEGPYSVVDSKTLELPKLNEPFTEQVTIESITKDEMVLSGGETWKFDKTKFTRPGAASGGFEKGKIVGSWEVVETNGFVEFGEPGSTVTFNMDGTMIKAGKQGTWDVKQNQLTLTEPSPNADVSVTGTFTIKNLTADILILDEIKFKRKR